MRIRKEKAVAVIREEVDSRGRYLRPSEFRWIMNYFRDRYDPRRLALALMFCAGLRCYDAVRCKRSDFSMDFSCIHMRQCKASVRCKDGVVRVRVKSRNMPLPAWLSSDLLNYEKFRLAYGYFTGHGDGCRMFPALRKQYLYNLFHKLRLRYGNKESWLREVWYFEHRIYEDGSRSCRAVHRVAPHAGRAMFCVAAKEACEGDLSEARVVTGHERVKDVERYTRFAETEVLKERVLRDHMDGLCPVQLTPLLKGQRKLCFFVGGNRNI